MFERLKKIWHEAKIYAEEMDDRVIKMPPAVFENEHETVQVNLSQKSERDTCLQLSFGGDEHSGTHIDTEIAALVAEMNKVGIHTTCSCQGHNEDEAYIGIRLGEGTSYSYRKDIFGPGQDELTLRWKRK